MKCCLNGKFCACENKWNDKHRPHEEETYSEIGNAHIKHNGNHSWLTRNWLLVYKLYKKKIFDYQTVSTKEIVMRITQVQSCKELNPWLITTSTCII